MDNVIDINTGVTYKDTLPCETVFEEQVEGDLFIEELRKVIVQWKFWGPVLLDYYLTGRKRECTHEFAAMLGVSEQTARAYKEHYFCIKRYQDYVTTIQQTGGKYSQVLAVLNRMDLERRGFDLDGVHLPNHIKAKICVKSNCVRCPHQSECRYASFIAQAGRKGAFDFQVTNHNLLLMSQKRKNTAGISLLMDSKRNNTGIIKRPGILRCRGALHL